MKRLRLFVALALLQLGVQASAAHLGSAPTHAGSSRAALNCSAALTGREIFGDIQVPTQQNCTITNTEIHGNVTLGEGSSLIIKDSNIHGHVLTQPGFVRLTLAGAIVGGQVSAGQGGSFNLDDSQVLNKVNIYGNSGNIRITRVTLNSDLNCWGNHSAPQGSWIRVDGAQTGQCRRL